MPRRRIDDLSVVGAGKLERLDAIFTRANDLDQGEFAFKWPTLGSEIGDLMDRHQTLKLVLDLRQHHWRAGRHDRDP